MYPSPAMASAWAAVPRMAMSDLDEHQAVAAGRVGQRPLGHDRGEDVAPQHPVGGRVASVDVVDDACDVGGGDGPEVEGVGGDGDSLGNPVPGHGDVGGD